MIEDFYSETAILLDYSSSTGGYWSTGAQYTTATSVSAAINLISSNRRFVGDDYAERAEYVMYTSVSTDIYAGRRVRWEGDTFEIVEDPQDVLQRGHHYRSLLRRVDA